MPSLVNPQSKGRLNVTTMLYLRLTRTEMYVTYQAVYDAPNLDALMKFAVEPEVMTWSGYHTTEIKPVMSTEESMKFSK